MADGGRNALIQFIMGRPNKPYVRKPNFDPFNVEEESESSFRANYRLTNGSVEALGEILKEKLQSKSNANKAYTYMQRLCCALRIFSGRSWQREVASMQNMSQPTVCRNLHRVCDALIELGKYLVFFDTDPDILQKSVNGFYSAKSKCTCFRYAVS